MNGMRGLLQMTARGATHWYVNLNDASRRNAMEASTALAQRRLEYLEVEEYLARHERRRDLHHRLEMRRTG